jgi:malate dehydrogenase (oxaloacetate-decarboxylating)
MTASSRADLERRAARPGEEALAKHARYRGKIQVASKCPIGCLEDFAVWYTPGVAAPCLAIRDDSERVFEYTNRGNSVAIVSDGTRVLGLGDIGPEAALPVMEGKALLFKYLGGVDAVPLCVRTRDADELVRLVEQLQPSFGGINLEDIAQPKCFRVLARAKESATIPVWHDDQQGTATVVLAGLINALEIVGKDLCNVRIALVGAGAANFATYELLCSAGADPQAFVVCDSRGILHPARADLASRRVELAEKWRLATETNPSRLAGGIELALRGADVCLAFSTPTVGTIEPSWIKRMANDAIVFACANPTPEVWPWDALSAGARVVATGRSDFPNQVNNSLAFPGIFRGVLDVRASSISPAMARAAADEIARVARERGLTTDAILPRIDDWEMVPRVAVATAMAATEEGLARLPLGREEIARMARTTIERARATCRSLFVPA